MEIESSRSSRIFWLILGVGLAGGFATFAIFVTLKFGPNLAMLSTLFPIGMGVATVLWLGRPAWIKVGAVDVSFVPPLGSAKVFPRSSVKQIIRVPGYRGGTHIEFRDQTNRKLVSFEQGFDKGDMEKLGQFLNAKLIWDVNVKDASIPEMIALMTPEEHADIMGRMSPEERAAEMSFMTPEQRVEVEKAMMERKLRR